MTSNNVTVVSSVVNFPWAKRWVLKTKHHSLAKIVNITSNLSEKENMSYFPTGKR